jgi:hypothetical protein
MSAQSDKVRAGLTMAQSSALDEKPVLRKTQNNFKN